MADRMDTQAPTTNALLRVAEGQERLIEALQGRETDGDGIDAESRMRLRSIDVQMLRILEEISAGRQETMAEIRTDLAALTRAMSQYAAGAVDPVKAARKEKRRQQREAEAAANPQKPGDEG